MPYGFRPPTSRQLAELQVIAANIEVAFVVTSMKPELILDTTSVREVGLINAEEGGSGNGWVGGAKCFTDGWRRSLQTLLSPISHDGAEQIGSKRW